jgi:Tol biopolymer transport system component
MSGQPLSPRRCRVFDPRVGMKTTVAWQHLRSMKTLGLAFAGLAGVVALLVGIAHPPVAHSAFPGHNGKIAYTKPSDLLTFTIRPDGSHRQRIARDFGYASFSSSGHRLVGNGRDPGGLYVVRADGSHRKRIPHTHGSDGGASFAPGGRRIIFNRWAQGHFPYELFTVRLNGTHLRQLTHDSTFSQTNPVFSPDGEKIAWADGCHLEVARANTSHERRITHPHGGCDLRPDFSPNGKRVVFQRTGGDGDDSILIVRTNGTHMREPRPRNRTDQMAPAFAPNRRQIVFENQRPHRGRHLARMRIDGSHLRKLPAGTSPSWGVRP